MLFLLLLLSPHTTATHNGRSLHEALVPPTVSPHPQPPTSENLFFHSTPSSSPPPSPPSSSTVASSPANVSTSPPKSNTASSKLLAVALVVSSVAVMAATSLVLCLCRRRRQRGNPIDRKTTRSDSGNTVYHVNVLPKLRRSTSTSSEFVYFPSVVNSHRVINHHVATNRASVDAFVIRSESPVLCPLSPLGRRDFRQMYANTVGVDRAEEEDEFYSPRGSSNGRASSIGTRSPSRRGFAPAAAENFDASGESSSSSSYSLSNSCSSTQSASFGSSRSPPISSRPRSLSIESPELVAVQTAPLPPAQSPLRPQPPVMIQLADLSSSPSPSPPSSSSPDRDSEKSLDSSPRTSDFSNSNAESPVKTYTVFWSRLNSSKNPPSEHVSSETHVENGDSPALVINFGSNHPNRWNSQSTSVPSSFSSPERPLGKNPESPLFVSNPLHGSMESQARLERTIQKPAPASIATTLPPPLPPLPGGRREKMVSTSSIGQPNLKSQVLITPSKESNRCPVLPSTEQENRVLDPMKAQNIAISLRALNVNIDEVREALSEGNVDALGTELLESLLKMAPTKEEEHRLKEYKDNSPSKLGPAERFLRAVLDIPFAFKRVDAMLYISNFEFKIVCLKKSLDTLEAACEELRNSRMFSKLLDAVLKTGNRINPGTSRGNAHAFKLDTLLNLVDVKGPDGKTTLLHFVVLEIIRTEGACFSGGNQYPNTTLDDDAKCRKLGLQAVSGLCSELKNVKKAATMDSEVFVGGIMKLSKGIEKIEKIVQLTEATGLKQSIEIFLASMKRFKRTAEQEIIRIRAQESVSLSLVKEITEYFHGHSAKEAAHPFRIFMVVRDFLAILDRVCKEVGMINDLTAIGSTSKFPIPVNPLLRVVNSGLPKKRNNSSDDDENSFT